MPTTTEPSCLRCGASGTGATFPVFPLTGVKFGEVCVTCDESSPWLASPLVCVDCETELDNETAYGNRKYGDPRCEDCFVEHQNDE